MKLNATVARPLGEERAEMAHQAVLDRIAPLNSCDHEYCPVTTQRRVLGEVVDESVVPLRLAESGDRPVAPVSCWLLRSWLLLR